MKATTSRIMAVAAVGLNVLRVTWRNQRVDRIDLSGWIETGGDILAPLRDPGLFGSARVADYGASIAWGDDDDLRIDAVHLQELAGQALRSHIPQ